MRLRGPKIVWKIGGALCFALMVAFLLMLNALLVWVATGPRNLEKVLPYIESALSGVHSGYNVKINQGVLLWDGWQHPMDIRLREVNIYTADGQRFATFPDISLGLDIFSLALGKVEPTSLEVRRPVISLFQDAAGNISFGQPAQQEGQEEEPASIDRQGAALSALAADFLSHDSSAPMHRLHRIEVDDANVSIGNTEQGVFLRAQNVHIVMRRGWRGISLKAQALLNQDAAGRPAAQVSADFRARPGDATFEGKVLAQSVWPGVFTPLLKDKDVLPALRFAISGWADISLGRDGVLQGVHFLLHGDRGSLRSAMLEQELPVEHVQVEGDMQGVKQLALDQFSIDFGSYGVQGSARLTMAPEGLAVQGRASAVAVPLNHIRRFWPVGLAPLSRDWIVHNITQGMANSATLTLNIPPGGLDKPVLPEGSLEALVGFSGATVRYLPEHPPAKGMSGTVRVGAKTLEAKVEHGTGMNSTQLSNGRVYIDDLNLDNPRIEVTLDAAGPASDGVAFMDLPPIQKASHLKLDKEKITGAMEGHAKIGFYFFAPKDASGKPRDDLGVDYEASASLKDVSQQGVLGKFDISHATGMMEVNNQRVHINGSGTVNGAATRKSDIVYRFHPENGIDTIIDASAKAPVSSLPRFGYPEMPFLTGLLDVDAHLEMGPETENGKAHVELKDAAVDWKLVGWQKPLSQPVTLDLVSEKKDGVTHLSQLSLSGRDTEVKGSVTFGKGLGNPTQYAFDPFRLGKSDAVVNYNDIPGGRHVEVHGKALDVSGLLQGTDDFSFAHFPALELTADVKKLFLSDKRSLSDVQGTATCSVEMCSAIDLLGRAEDKPFTFKITGAPRARTLLVSAQDAGALLRALDIYPSMHGGVMTMDGKFSDTAGTHVLAGTLLISEHTIENAPVLAKLLALSSITGLGDALGGHGIAFTKLKAPFTLQDDVITLKDAKTHGASLGLTADGTIRFPGKIFDLKGAIVPAYTVNSVLKHVPLVGGLITGGGDGVFAARYSIKGPSSNPDVSVNPLSILTPGFLRGLFDIFDSGDSPSTPNDKSKDSKGKATGSSGD